METMSPAMLEIPAYYRWMIAQLEPYLGDTVLDVGTGPGTHLPYLGSRRVIATDLSAACLDELARRFPGVETLRADASDPALADRLAGYGVDTITCLNVLEHIPDDGRALETFARILRPRRGRLTLVVPAHPALYGSMDRLADHLRRYSLRPLVRLVEARGFRPLLARHFNVVGGLAWYLNAKLLPVRELSAPSVNWQIRVFGRVVLPVARLGDTVLNRWLRVPFGQSLIVIATPRD
jgi:SAM-dependent methyltransferase